MSSTETVAVRLLEGADVDESLLSPAPPPQAARATTDTTAATAMSNRFIRVTSCGQ